MKRLLIRPGDLILIVLLLAVSVAVTFATIRLPQGSRAVVSVDGEVTAVLALGVEQSIQVKGPLGVTVIQSDSEGVRVISSPCPHKYCVRMGVASIRGQVILCVPNRVAVRVEDDAQSGFDGVTG